MNSKCRCGGKMEALSDNHFYFRWRCSKCGSVSKQHKRRSIYKLKPVSTFGTIFIKK